MGATTDEPADAGRGTRRGRGRPTSHSAQDTRDVILDTALRMFGTSGYRGVSMEALAAGCGLNSRAIYYHFASKQDLFDAVTAVALQRFGAEVVTTVFIHPGLRERVGGYVEVYRTLHEADPHLVPFIGRMLVEILSDQRDTSSGAVQSPAARSLRQLLESLVDDAIDRGEVHAALDRDGAVQLLVAIGMGLSLASLDDTDAYLPMLDALEMLTAGTLFVEPAPEVRPRQG